MGHRAQHWFRVILSIFQIRISPTLLALIVLGVGISLSHLMFAAGLGTGSLSQKIFGGIVMIGSPLLALTLVVVEGRRDKCESFPPGHYVSCGYNLTGNVSGRCPECGVAIHKEIG